MLAVIIATAGRPYLIPPMLSRLGRQTRPADVVVLVPGKPGDLPADVGALAEDAGCNLAIVEGVAGLTAQRNAGLDWLRGNTGIFESGEGTIVFFDDDFVPRADWFGNAVAEFARNPRVVGLTGTVVADGVKGRGLAEDEAERRLAASAPGAQVRPATLYGCNMAVRASAAAALRFDEALPLYGWQEDYDYSRRLAKAGPVMRAGSLLGVHMGTKSGRLSGHRFGYSQVANPVYLVGKGTMGPSKFVRLLGGNIATNLTKSVFPEPYVDRRGRLVGNAMAFWDLVTGRLDPNKITSIPATRAGAAVLRGPGAAAGDGVHGPQRAKP